MSQKNTAPATAWEAIRRLLACNKTQLAEHLGIDRKTLNRWETGQISREGLEEARALLDRITRPMLDQLEGKTFAVIDKATDTLAGVVVATSPQEACRQIAAARGDEPREYREGPKAGAGFSVYVAPAGYRPDANQNDVQQMPHAADFW